MVVKAINENRDCGSVLAMTVWRIIQMKKVINVLAILLVAAMAIASVSCGGGNADVNAEIPTVTPGKLTMSTNADFPPYEFIAGGQVVGIDPDIAAAIAEKLGLELEIMNIDFDSVIISVETGMADIAMAGLTVTEERMEQINFSTSYAKGVQVIIVPEGSSITSVDDLFADGAFHSIGVQLSTTGDLYSTWDLEEEGLASIERYPKGTDAVMALLAGRVDAVIIDNEPARHFVELNPGLKILDTEFADEDYAIGINKGNTVLFERLNQALNELIADGTVKAIVDNYITV